MSRYYYHGWTKDEERILSEIMLNGGRKKIGELFIEAAQRLERTVSACQNRWHDIKPKNKAV
jgi:hypothetical protein